MKKQIAAVALLAAALGIGACRGTDKVETASQAETEALTGTQAPTLSSQEDKTLVETEYRALAKGVQAIIADRDLKKLEEAVTYPCFLGIGEGVIVESEEEFMDLAVDEVITEELIKAVTEADVDSVDIVEAGLVVGDKSGKPNITIGQGEDKTIGIVGFNY